jgi:hypothetical protein
MSVVLNVPVGRTKREIVILARNFCGISSAEFDLGPDEMSEHILMLDVMMGDGPWNLLGYLAGQPSLAEDRSNLADADVSAVYMELGKRIALGMGVELTPARAGQAGKSFIDLTSRYTTPPTQPWRGGTPRGSGNRWGLGYGSYLYSGTE